MTLDRDAIRNRAQLARSIAHGPNALWRARASADDVPTLLAALAAVERDRDRLRDELEQARQLVAQYAPIAVPILADIKARKERAARAAAHTHYCWTCSDGTKPGGGCHNCRNTGMDQTPCVGCPGPQPAAEHSGT